MAGEALGARRYRVLHNLNAATIKFDQNALAELSTVVGDVLLNIFRHAERVEGGMIEFLLQASSSLWTNTRDHELSALGQALLPISRWRNHPQEAEVPNTLEQIHQQWLR